MPSLGSNGKSAKWRPIKTGKYQKKIADNMRGMTACILSNV